MSAHWDDMTTPLDIIKRAGGTYDKGLIRLPQGVSVEACRAAKFLCAEYGCAMEISGLHGHDFHDREDGLAHCRTCGGAEASLPRQCPGRWMTEPEEKLVQDGVIDYMNGSWVYFRVTPIVKD